MMRSKVLKPVVTFDTTSDAMAMEAAAREHGIPGRIIPVPSEIDSGCGLAWGAEPDQKDILVEALATHAIAHDAVYDVWLY